MALEPITLKGACVISRPYNARYIMKHVNIFTDGACRGNPGPGGWAALLRYQTQEKIISGTGQNLAPVWWDTLCQFFGFGPCLGTGKRLSQRLGLVGF